MMLPEKPIECHACGSRMREEKSDMPFKVSRHKVVIFKDLPVFQCAGYGEFLIADPVMAEVEALFEKPGGIGIASKGGILAS